MSDYLKSAYNFMERHKRKLITLGVISSLGVAGYYYAKRMVQKGMKQFEEIGKELQQHMLEQQQREDELERIREESTSMILTFIPPLRSKIKICTDPKPVTERLKTFRQKQNSAMPGEMEKLWEELKVVSIARLLSSIYALCVLNMLLRIQLYVLARIAFNEYWEARKKRQSDSSHETSYTTKITRQVRERFLFAASDHLINSGEGMQILVDKVSTAIREETKDWLMGTDAKISRSDLVEKIELIRKNLEAEDAESSETRDWLTDSIIPKDESNLFAEDRELSKEQNTLITDMLNETMDMVECPMFAEAVKESLNLSFDVLIRDLRIRNFGGNSTRQMSNQNPRGFTKSESTSAQIEEIDEDEEKYLLTKLVVTLLKQVANEVTNADGESNEYVEQLKKVQTAEDFCTQIFNQGIDSSSPLDALGDLGLGGEDMQEFTKLLSGIAGGEDFDFMKMLGGDGQELLNMMNSTQNNNGESVSGQMNPSQQDEEMMRLITGMMNQQTSSSSQRAQTPNEEIERLFGR